LFTGTVTGGMVSNSENLQNKPNLLTNSGFTPWYNPDNYLCQMQCCFCGDQFVIDRHKILDALNYVYTKGIFKKTIRHKKCSGRVVFIQRLYENDSNIDFNTSGWIKW
jgi:hypothetical protein